MLAPPQARRSWRPSRSAAPAWGNCSCSEKLRLDKSVDLLVAVGSDPAHGCTEGYDPQSASAFIDCPRGTGLTGVPAGKRATRQQAQR